MTAAYDVKRYGFNLQLGAVQQERRDVRLTYGGQLVASRRRLGHWNAIEPMDAVNRGASACGKGRGEHEWLGACGVAQGPQLRADIAAQ